MAYGRQPGVLLIMSPIYCLPVNRNVNPGCDLFVLGKPRSRNLLLLLLLLLSVLVLVLLLPTT
jgi:hypothetical protein